MQEGSFGARSSSLAGSARSSVFELDYGPITDLDGVQTLDVSILKFTECRKLERLDALADSRRVTLLSLARYNAVADHSPLGAMKGLRSLFIEARELGSIDLVGGTAVSAR